MKELTVEAIQEKLKKVDEDLALLRSTGDASRKTEILLQYKEYLEEELRDARKNQRNI